MRRAWALALGAAASAAAQPLPGDRVLTADAPVA